MEVRQEEEKCTRKIRILNRRRRRKEEVKEEPYIWEKQTREMLLHDCN